MPSAEASPGLRDRERRWLVTQVRTAGAAAARR
jgi:hypothetical protein